MAAREIPVTQARAELAEIVNRVAYSGERVVLTRHGKPLAAIVPAADLDRLTAEEQISVVSIGPSEPYQPSSSTAAANTPLRIAAEHRPEGPSYEPGRTHRTGLHP